MSKVAKLVRVAFVTRVVVDENASDEQIFEAARPSLKQKAAEEMFENLDSIENDVECPYGELNGETNKYRKYDKNGVLITNGCAVLVPDPTCFDLHNHGFVGQVKGFIGLDVIVVDGDGDIFEFEPERLEVQDEE